MHEKSYLQFSGLGLCGLSLWTFLGHHKAFLVVIPNYTYQLIVLLTLATACLIFVNALIGLLSVKLQRKCIICLVITEYKSLARIISFTARQQESPFFLFFLTKELDHIKHRGLIPLLLQFGSFPSYPAFGD